MGEEVEDHHRHDRMQDDHELQKEMELNPMLPKPKVLEQWMMHAAQDADQPAQVLRALLYQNPAFGAYMSTDEELGNLVRLFAKRFRAKIMVAETPIKQETLFQPICEVCWRTVGLVLKSCMALNDTPTALPLSKDAQGQLRMLLNTNAELSRKLSQSRRDYLRELSQHRDKQRRISSKVQDMLDGLQEEPIMFFEPLSFVLDDTTKDFIKLVVEERVKLGMHTFLAAALKEEEDKESSLEDLEGKLSKAERDMRSLRNSAAREADARERAEHLAEQLQRKLQAATRDRDDLRDGKDELSAKVGKLEGDLTTAVSGNLNSPNKLRDRKDEMKYMQELQQSLEQAQETIEDYKVQVERLQRVDRQHQHLLLASAGVGPGGGSTRNNMTRKLSESVPDKDRVPSKNPKQPSFNQPEHTKKEVKPTAFRKPAGQYDEASRKEVQALKKEKIGFESRIRELEHEVEDYKNRMSHMVLKDAMGEEVNTLVKKHAEELATKQEEIDELLFQLEEAASLGSRPRAMTQPLLQASSALGGSHAGEHADEDMDLQTELEEVRVQLRESDARCEELDEHINDLMLENDKLEAKIKVLMESMEGEKGKEEVQEELRKIEEVAAQPKKKHRDKKKRRDAAFERLYGDAQRRVEALKMRQQMQEEAEERARQSAANLLKRRNTMRTEQILQTLQRASAGADADHEGSAPSEASESNANATPAQPGITRITSDDLAMRGPPKQVLGQVTDLLLKLQAPSQEGAEEPNPTDVLNAVFDTLAVVLERYDVAQPSRPHSGRYRSRPGSAAPTRPTTAERTRPSTPQRQRPASPSPQLLRPAESPPQMRRTVSPMRRPKSPPQIRETRTSRLRRERARSKHPAPEAVEAEEHAQEPDPPQWELAARDGDFVRQTSSSSAGVMSRSISLTAFNMTTASSMTAATAASRSPPRSRPTTAGLAQAVVNTLEPMLGIMESPSVEGAEAMKAAKEAQAGIETPKSPQPRPPGKMGVVVPNLDLGATPPRDLRPTSPQRAVIFSTTPMDAGQKGPATRAAIFSTTPQDSAPKGPAIRSGIFSTTPQESALKGPATRQSSQEKVAQGVLPPDDDAASGCLSGVLQQRRFEPAIPQAAQPQQVVAAVSGQTTAVPTQAVGERPAPRGGSAAGERAGGADRPGSQGTDKGSAGMDWPASRSSDPLQGLGADRPGSRGTDRPGSRGTDRDQSRGLGDRPGSRGTDRPSSRGGGFHIQRTQTTSSATSVDTERQAKNETSAGATGTLPPWLSAVSPAAIAPLAGPLLSTPGDTAVARSGPAERRGVSPPQVVTEAAPLVRSPKSSSSPSRIPTWEPPTISNPLVPLVGLPFTPKAAASSSRSPPPAARRHSPSSRALSGQAPRPELRETPMADFLLEQHGIRTQMPESPVRSRGSRPGSRHGGPRTLEQALEPARSPASRSPEHEVRSPLHVDLRDLASQLMRADGSGSPHGSRSPSRTRSRHGQPLPPGYRSDDWDKEPRDFSMSGKSFAVSALRLRTDDLETHGEGPPMQGSATDGGKGMNFSMSGKSLSAASFKAREDELYRGAPRNRTNRPTSQQDQRPVVPLADIHSQRPGSQPSVSRRDTEFLRLIHPPAGNANPSSQPSGTRERQAAVTGSKPARARERPSVGPTQGLTLGAVVGCRQGGGTQKTVAQSRSLPKLEESRYLPQEAT